MKILFTGGGSAGHIFPLLAVIRELKKSGPGDLQLFYVGPKDNFTKDLMVKEGVTMKIIAASKMRRYFSLWNVVDFFKFPLSLAQAFYHVFTISPDLIFSKGGYGSLPVTMVGRVLLTPIFLHESDIIPGLANRISSKFALEVFTAFPVERISLFPPEKMIAVGNPIRQEIMQGRKENAQKAFNLAGGRPVILLMGGSQGAAKLNDTLLVVLSDMLKDFEVIHQTGEAHFKQVKAEAETVLRDFSGDYYHPLPFINEEQMALAYAVCDLIVSRAGAGSIFEIAATGKPSIIIPLSSAAQNHQVKNAYAFGETGASLVMEESNFTPYFFLEQIRNLLADKKRLIFMSERAKEFSRPQAAKIIADYILAYLQQ